MAISPNSPIFSNLIDDDGAETVLVEADHVKSLILEFDLSKLFGQVNDGLWISANVSNVNGINTIIVDDYNNTEVGQALLDGFAESLQMKFE